MIEVKILHHYNPNGQGSRMREIGTWLKDHGLKNVGDWEFDFVHENNQTYYLIKIHSKFEEIATMLKLKWG